MRIHSQRGHKSDVLNIVLHSQIALSTRVIIAEGAIESLPQLMAQNGIGRKALLVTQPSVKELWAKPIISNLESHQFQTDLLELPDGEQCKRHDLLLTVWQKLQERQFTRSDCLIAIGGGALSDLAGFAASTYLRGIKLILIPTTLLAQVDAAIGGKTGINLPSGKNLAGSFYFPCGIIVDPLTLATLPAREIKSGLGEIIKYGLIESTVSANTDYRSGPRSFFAALEDIIGTDDFKADNPAIASIIAACVKMKLAVIGKDPFEEGLRRCLNLGHTLGHAVEKVSQYTVSHGEAVAIGLVFACKLAVSRGQFASGDLERLLAILAAAGLPAAVPAQLAGEQLLQAMAFDKKRQGEEIKFVLPVKPFGTVDIEARLSLNELKEFLR